MTAIAPFVRILLRYVSGYLIARGLLDPAAASDFVDPELVGAIVMAVNEAWYFAARRFGWEK